MKGLSAVAGPVFDASGRCVASLNIAGPSERFRTELALMKENFSAEAALENVPGGPEVLARIREAQGELAAKNGDVEAAINIAQRFFDAFEEALMYDFDVKEGEDGVRALA